MSDVSSVTLDGAPSTATDRPVSGTLPRLLIVTVPVSGVPGNTWSDRLDGLDCMPTSSNWACTTSSVDRGEGGGHRVRPASFGSGVKVAV